MESREVAETLRCGDTEKGAIGEQVLGGSLGKETQHRRTASLSGWVRLAHAILGHVQGGKLVQLVPEVAADLDTDGLELL